MVFLIIFGTRGVTMSAGRGEFHCPSCDRRCGYGHKRVRRFFTLYFIPIIPLDVLGEYVECDSCSSTFTPEVLSYDPAKEDAAFEAEFHSAVRRVMVLMMLADGKIDEEEISTIQTVYGKIAKKDVARTEVEREIEAAKKDGRGLQPYLKSVVGRLNDSGKEIVIKAAIFVAAADGKVTDEETTLLAELASALEMSPTHFKSVIAEMTS
jgi:tellurite resistance protein